VKSETAACRRISADFGEFWPFRDIQASKSESPAAVVHDFERAAVAVDLAVCQL